MDVFSVFAKKKKPLPDPALIDRGAQATELLKSEVFHTCMEELEKEVWGQFFSTPADSMEAREVLYQYISTLKLIKERLETYAAAGKLAKHQQQLKKTSK